MKRLLLGFLVIIVTFPSFGQSPRNLYGFIKSNTIEVTQKGKKLKFPWVGGINGAHVNTIDLNRDGIQDLVLFDKEGKNFQAYITAGLGSAAHYEYAPQYEKILPPVDISNYWTLFRDYNCDGKKDIFLGYANNVYVWKNTSSNTSLSFELANNGKPLISLYPVGILNLNVNSANLPGIADINNDGALDVLTYANFGTEMQYHQGQAPCGLDFEVTEQCWGHFTETGTNPGVNLNACLPHKKKTMDGSSTIMPIDLDNDQVQDLIIGNGTFKSLAALYNGGDLDSAHMVFQNVSFPTSHPVNIFSAPAPFYEDVDFDGLKDFLVSPSPLPGGKSVNQNSLHFYKNVGNTAIPSFAFQQEDFLQGEMIDAGKRSVPRLADLNGDGKLDLIVANYEYQLKDSVFGHSYYYYQNTSTANQTAFTLVDTNFMNISSYGIKDGSVPTFGDLDGDGDLDAIVGDINGSLHYFTNSSATNPSFSHSSQLMNISGLVFTSPFLYDIDSNGTLDLFVGNDLGTMYYYSNSSSTSPNFLLEDIRLGGFSTKGTGATYGYSIPYLFKNNGVDNLFVGSYNAGIFQFDSLAQIMSQPPLLQPIIGSGNTASTSEDETPFGINRKNGRNQILIKASELRAAGMVLGYINGLSFYVTTSSNNNFDLIIKIKNTGDSVLNSFGTGFTQVYNNRTRPYQGWHYLSFSEPFLWDGASSILLEVCFSGQQSSRNIHVQMTDVGFNANAYGDYVDPTLQGNGCAQPYLSSSTNRPNIKLRATPAFANTENYGSGIHTAPAVADLNNDGFMDMIVGNMNGGLTYYEGKTYDVGIEEQAYNQLGELIVFPNPGTGKYMVSTPNTGQEELNIYNLNGKMVLRQKVSSEETQVDLTKQPDGMYLFLLRDNENLRVAKVIKK